MLLSCPTFYLMNTYMYVGEIVWFKKTHHSNTSTTHTASTLIWVLLLFGVYSTIIWDVFSFGFHITKVVPSFRERRIYVICKYYANITARPVIPPPAINRSFRMRNPSLAQDIYMYTYIYTCTIHAPVVSCCHPLQTCKIVRQI